METNKNRHGYPADLSKEDMDRMSTDEKIDAFVQGYRLSQTRSKTDAMEMLRMRIEQSNATKPARNLRIYWYAAASVLIVVMISTIFFHTGTPEIVATPKGQHLEYALPDNSTVILNADSKITFQKSGFTEKRTLKLEGEAFFSVLKGEPFVVETSAGKVEVLGTKLNVYARGTNMSVSCLTGKVKVTAGEQSTIIEPGEKADLVSGELKKTGDLDTSLMAKWRTGEFHFDNAPLISIFDEIARQFDVQITTKGLENRFFTGDFSNKNLDEVLETVCLPMELDYEIRNGNQIIVRPKKE